MNIIKVANKIIDENNLVGVDDPFYLLNLQDVVRKYQNWIMKIPKVVPFYAVKCNDDHQVLKVLSNIGAGFDCASKNEIAKILSLNVDPSRIIYSHTEKQVSHLKFAAKRGVEKLTFDCSEELHKIKKFHPEAKVVLRIKYDASTSMFSMSTKFGCDPKIEAPKLIKLCIVMGMNLIGISFHVGTGTKDFDAYGRALDVVRELFDYAESLDLKLNFVDIGGGFIGQDSTLLDQYADSINSGIERNFVDKNIKFIAEPGRYFVDSAMSIVTQIISKRNSDDGQIFYYINESVHLSFIAPVMFFNEYIKFSVIRKTKIPTKIYAKKLSTIWGCTCSTVDKIIACRILSEMEIGDWIVFHNMGAYSKTLATEFNGFKKGKIYAVDDNGNELKNCNSNYFL